MFRRLAFDIRYAYQNVMRSGLWTVFAVFCIAAGVAAVVALRSLGFAIGDTLVSTARTTNNGDITLFRGDDSPFAAITGIPGVGGDNDGDQSFSVFDEATIADVRAYIEERDGTLSVYKLASGVQVAAPDAVTTGRPQFVSVFLIDPATYNPLGPVEAVDPPGVPLSELLPAGENVIVVSENFAEPRGIEVGDELRVSGTDEPFTVTGIAATAEEASLLNLISAFFGFAYIHEGRAELINVPPEPNRISAVFPPGSDIRQIDRDLTRLTPRYTDVRNVESMEESFGQVSDILGRVIVIAGLGALVIGGVGIINTMLVMVRRRTMEIATLKTFGVRGRQVAGLFIWEALILGLMGSIAGVILGTLLGVFVNQFGEAFLQQALVWRFYPEAALYGMVLGLSVTVVFGVLPVLTAVRVRPAIVLRPNETHIPVAGILQGLLALMIVIVSIGIMVGSITGGAFVDGGPFADTALGERVGALGLYAGNFLVGIIATAIAMAFIGVLVLVMWGVVWLVSRLPAFGIVDLRLALRNMTSGRWRTATTLLALIAGMYALSSITFVSQSVRDVLQFQLSNTLGGNVLVFPLTTIFSSPELAEPFINARVDGLEGVEGRTRSDFYFVEAVALDGEAITSEAFTFTDEDGAEQTFTEASFAMLSRRSTDPQLTSGQLIAGRDLTPEDAGQPYIVLREDAINEGALVPEVGQTLTITTENSRARYDLEVIGIVSGGGPNFAGGFTPINAINVRANGSLTTVRVAEAHLDEALIALSALPTVFVLDISFIDGLLQNLVDQFSALPTVVGLMALLAAAAIMMNTVLLATLERRKQIGVMEAVGIKRRRVLGILLLENTLIALLGAGIGIGLSAFNSSLLTLTGIGEAIPVPSNAIPLTVGLVSAAVLLSWFATFASAGVITRENIINILRYD